MTDKEYFDGKCPYTDNSCDKWDCLSCDMRMRNEYTDSIMHLKKYSFYAKLCIREIG